MNYRRFKISEKPHTVASVATVAAYQAPYTPLARVSRTAKFNNNNNININFLPTILHKSEGESSCKDAAVSHAAVSIDAARQAATVATVATLCAGLATFKKARPYGITSFRHEQASWAAEMFLQEWGAMAAEFGWMPGDLFERDGLAYWLETEIVTALGPEHAITEGDGVYDRVTRARLQSR